MNFKTIMFTISLILVVNVFNLSAASRKTNILRQKETNPVKFIRLAVMRLVYGVATRLGFGEQISEALNGAFVPPGVEDYDYEEGGLGIFQRDDSDEYF
ncbi:unnamed protein product [Callosobruchus maculatus]|uniref:Uncharacterized protein n=1 Tax=Callosobruchus maculatus TaxID=64391 RepID=A0A653BIK2_CALMS|nr:unnamed protein product [Callosobruchus maculatus]